MSDPRIPQGFPAEPPGFPVPLFATGAGALAPHYYADPLVTAAGLGFTGWWMRVTGTLRQLWPSLLAVGALVMMPAFAWSLARPAVPLSSIGAAGYQPDAGSMLGDLGVKLAIGLVCGGLGTAASVWIMVRRANGLDAAFGRAIWYGARRALPVAGWQALLYLVLGIAGLIGFGILQCLGVVGALFGILLVFALFTGGAIVATLIGPIVALRASDNPIGMSAELIKQNLGAALGRILLTSLIAEGPPVVLGLVTSLLISEVQSVPSPVLAIAEAVGGVWSAIFLPVGMLVTYAELRARSMPMLSADLLGSMEPERSWPVAQDWPSRPAGPSVAETRVTPATRPAVPPQPGPEAGHPGSG